MDEFFDQLENRFGTMPKLLRRRWEKEAKHCMACGVKLAYRAIDAWLTPRADYDPETRTVRGIVCGRCKQVCRLYERPEQVKSVGRYLHQRRSAARCWRIEHDKWEDLESEIDR